MTLPLLEFFVSDWIDLLRKLKSFNVLINYFGSAKACIAFANRSTRKNYVAIVNGDLNVDKWPELSIKSELVPIVPKTHAKLKRRKQDATTYADSWQDICVRQQTLVLYAKLQDLIGNPEEMDNEAAILSKFSEDDFIKDKKIRKRLRKLIYRTHGSDVIDPSQYGPNDDGPRLEVCLKDQDPPVDASPVYGDTPLEELIAGRQASVYRLRDRPGVLHVSIPLFEVRGSFRVFVGCGDECYRGKLCETELQVLGREGGEAGGGGAVTRVLLTPLSGRRHQLRLHCACLGHAIGTSIALLRSNLIRYCSGRCYVQPGGAAGPGPHAAARKGPKVGGGACCMRCTDCMRRTPNALYKMCRIPFQEEDAHALQLSADGVLFAAADVPF